MIRGQFACLRLHHEHFHLSRQASPRHRGLFFAPVAPRLSSAKTGLTSGTAYLCRSRQSATVTIRDSDYTCNKNESDVVRALAALSPDTPASLSALVAAGEDGLTPSDSAYHLDIAPSRLSFHLKELQFAGLISQERDGRNLIYRAQFDRMERSDAYLTAHCCGGKACEVTKRVRSKVPT